MNRRDAGCSMGGFVTDFYVQVGLHESNLESHIGTKRNSLYRDSISRRILTNCALILLQFPTQNSTLVFPSSFLQDRAMTAAI
ncbi:hypothetical protein P8452_73491 [Trifolium repens]|nr:hypothetical protein P8452_73491 [Trifolium repens]